MLAWINSLLWIPSLALAPSSPRSNETDAKALGGRIPGDRGLKLGNSGTEGDVNLRGFRPEDSFLGQVALSYDEEDFRGDEDETVGFLKEIAKGADCLELAIGTGRIALLLASQGLRVDGIELSPDMIKVLRGKSGGADLPVVKGDMSTTEMSRTYGLVYLVFNTIGNVLTQDGQVKCFENAARHLEPGGRFVLECRVPTAPSRGDRGFVEVYDMAVEFPLT